MVDGVHGDADDSGGGKVFVVDVHATGQNDSGQVAWYWRGEAESLFNAGV